MLYVKLLLNNRGQYLVANYFKRIIANIKILFKCLISTCCFILNLQPTVVDKM